MKERKLTLALMDPPYESANSTTALRIISAALEKGIDVNVFAYEGAVSLPLKDQAPHANPVKGTSVEEEEHPTTKAFISSLLAIGKDKGVSVFAIREDLEERGINLSHCLAGVQIIRRHEIALLLDDHDQIWHW